eukprot:Em0004g619a
MMSIVDLLLFYHSFSRHFREGDFIVMEGRIEHSGTGTEHFVDGLVYTGQWKNDKMNGKGEVKYTTKATLLGTGEFTDTSNRVGCGLFTGKVADGLRLKIS